MTGDSTLSEESSTSSDSSGSSEFEVTKKKKQTKPVKRKPVKRAPAKGSRGRSDTKKLKKETSDEESFSDPASSIDENATSVPSPAEDFLERVSKKRVQSWDSMAQFRFNKKRVRVLSKVEDFPEGSDGVLYWMSRDQRVQDNWAFLYAQRLALKLESPLYVCFCLAPKSTEETIRQYGFMMKGLVEVEKECIQLNIPFHLLQGEAGETIPKFMEDNKIGGVVTDFSPLRESIKRVTDLKESLPENLPFCQVDAHNIVPCWVASSESEINPRSMSNKIHSVLNDFMTEFPPLVKHPHNTEEMPKAVDWERVDCLLKVDRAVSEVGWAKPGTEAGLRMLKSFCEERLERFSSCRNDANKDAASNLSPWINFGQISVQRCVIMVKEYQSKYMDSVSLFFEEAVIKRELADNFCFYSKHYDSVKGAADWALKSIQEHRDDEHPYLYTRHQLEHGKTHDAMWNAAQVQLVTEGRMHHFLRVYWSKKFFDWSESREIALSNLIYINDRYFLDGRDPNGYAGCMWSICGVHDQRWVEQPLYGRIRFMTFQYCKKRLDTNQFIKKYKHIHI